MRYYFNGLNSPVRQERDRISPYIILHAPFNPMFVAIIVRTVWFSVLNQSIVKA